MQRIHHEFFYTMHIEINLRRNDEVIGISGVNEPLLVKITECIGKLIVNRNHHHIGNQRRKWSSLRQTSIEKSQIQGLPQLCLAVRKLYDFAEWEHHRKHFDNIIQRGATKEIVQIQLAEPFAVVFLMALDRINRTSVFYVGECRSVIQRMEIFLKNSLEIPQCVHQLRFRGINTTQTTRLFGDVECFIQSTAFLCAKRLRLLIKAHQFADKSVRINAACEMLTYRFICIGSCIRNICV